MENQTIEVNLRNELGSSAVRRLRKTGKVPAVVYGEGKDAVPVTIDLRQYRKVTSGAASSVYKTRSSDSNLNDLMVLIKDESIYQLKDQLLHVDFLSIHEGQVITVEVPVEIIGECVSVKQGFAILNQTAHEIEVSCTPNNIPQKFVVDVSTLEIAHSIVASEIVLPAGVTLETSPDAVIVSATVKHAEEEKPAEEVAVEGAAAAEGAAVASKETQSEEKSKK